MRTEVRQTCRDAGEGGFSLLELLVAVAILSLAAVTLIESQAGAVRLTTAVSEQTLAGIVAENRIALALGRLDPPLPGIRTGTETQFGQAFHWREQVRAVPANGVLVIDVTVEGPGGGQAAQLTAYRKES